ncbi:hypothetical protein MKX01_010777 [Papaver californicum]|nr:hypothetical protein MKX01_010777 [Papaver californicum]
MTTETVKCERFHQALCECHKRIPAGPTRDSACRHLNRSLAQCLVSVACPSESEVVRSLCSSGGTSLKRSQCQQAQLSLSHHHRLSSFFCNMIWQLGVCISLVCLFFFYRLSDDIHFSAHGSLPSTLVDIPSQGIQRLIF